MNIFILLVLEFLHIFVMSSSKKLNLCPNEQSIYLHFLGYTLTCLQLHA